MTPTGASRKNAQSRTVKLDIASRFEMLEMVQTVLLRAAETAGFDPAAIPDPLAEENLLKADGRGIFFMRQFMDEVAYSFPPRGGTVVKMTKRVSAKAR